MSKTLTNQATQQNPAAPLVGESLKSGSLSTTDIVFMVVAAAAPLTVIAGGLPIGIATGNGAGYPFMYLFSAVVLAIFTVGLMAISRFVPEGGSFSGYVEATFGRRAGMATAYLALLTYTAVQFAVYAYLGALLQGTFAPLVDLPWWVYTLAMIALVGFLGYRDIELSSKALGLCLIGEIAIVVLLDIFIIGKGGESGLSFETFSLTEITSGAPGVGLMMAMAGFIGFEATTVFRGEAKNPDKTVPRATYIAIAIIGVFYTISGWAIIQGVGMENVVEAASTDPEAMVAGIAASYLGGWAGPVVHVLLITSLFAAVLSFHNVLTRFQHNISHKRGLPRVLRRVHFKHNSPHLSSIVQTLTATSLVLVSALFALDLILSAFTWGTGITTLTFVLLMAITSVAVISFFRQRPQKELSIWNTLVAPTIALIGLIATLFFIIQNIDSLSGGNAIASIVILIAGPVALITGWVSATFIPELDEKLKPKKKVKAKK